MTKKGTIRGARRASGRGDRTRCTPLDTSLTDPVLGIQYIHVYTDEQFCLHQVRCQYFFQGGGRGCGPNYPPSKTKKSAELVHYFFVGAR